MSPSSHQLFQGLHITETDLQANRAGHLSASQRSRLLRQETFAALVLSLFAAVMWCVAYFVHTSATPSIGPRVLTLDLALAITFLATSLWPTVVALATRSSETRSIQESLGPMSVEKRKNRSGKVYLAATFNDLPLDLSSDTLALIQSGSSYRVYTYQGTFVALEPSFKNLTPDEERAVATTHVWQQHRNQRFQRAALIACALFPIALVLTYFLYWR